jgi:hypothetical protein
VTDAELRQYADQWVEVRLTNGESVIGKLIASEGQYAVEQPSANIDERPPIVVIPNAGVVVSVRGVARPPDTID